LKIIVVTPAGRRVYLELLASYVLNDDDVYEWQLWDNCREEVDRVYINELAKRNSKIKVVRLPGVDGTNRSINRFYRHCNDLDVFYVKLDDDIVYIERGTFARMLEVACQTVGRCIWWSPLVINNALCSYLIKCRSSNIDVRASLTAQASCPSGWSSPQFAIDLHESFLEFLQGGGPLVDGDFDISLSRFSINCIGFFGADVVKLGDSFCPLDVDDEEWISGVLPLLTTRSGRVLGGKTVSHYSFYTQEIALNETDILDKYYAHAGVFRRHPFPQGRRASWRFRLTSFFKFWLARKLIELGLRRGKSPLVTYIKS